MPGQAEARASAQHLRRLRARRLAIRLGLLVGLPTIVASIYYLLIASPQYDSVATVLVRAGGDSESSDSSFARLPPGKGEQPQVRLIREFIHSRALLQHLIDEHGFLQHYSGDSVDWWSRLEPDAGADESFTYYRGHVRTSYDSKIGALHLRVRAFSPEVAQALSVAILAAAERHNNDAAENFFGRRKELADTALAAAAERLAQTRAKLKRVQARAEARVEAGGDDGDVEVERAVLAESMARGDFDSALTELKSISTERGATQIHFIAITPPSRPDSIAAPRRMWSIATVFFTSFALMGIVTLLWGAIREHAKV